MALVIVIFFIAIIAFAMYDAISPQLPKQFQLDKGAVSTEATGGSSADGTGARMAPASASRWTVMFDGANSRVEREFSGHIRGGARQFDPPTLYLSCYQGAMYAWLDTRLHAASSAQDPARVQVQVNNLPAELWVRQEGQNIAATNARELVTLIQTEAPLHVTLAFGEAPPQTLTLNTDGFSALAATALEACTR
jgi:hypothetical protein